MLPNLATELIAGLAVVLLTVLLGRLQRKRRVLEWSTTTSVLLSRRGDLRDRVRITFDNNEVDLVWVTVIDLINVGNDAVLPAHFVEPIRLDLQSNVRLLDVSLSGEAVEDGQVTRDGSALRMAPRLFNPGDTLRITCLSDQEMDHELYARAENTELRWRKSSPKGIGSRSQSVRTAALLVLIVLLAVVFVADLRDDSLRIETLLLMLLAVGVLLAEVILLALNQRRV